MMEVKGQNIIMTAEYYHIYLNTTTVIWTSYTKLFVAYDLS